MSYAARRKTESVTLAEVGVDFLGIKAKWVSDREQQTAAWEMYVELVTRVALQELPGDRGLLREALTSLHSLFGETRRILKQHGPGVARRLTPDSIAFAQIALTVLNVSLRPFLSKWHPALQDYETARGDKVSPFAHEQQWSENKTMRGELDVIREQLHVYADLLAEGAGIDALHVTQP